MTAWLFYLGALALMVFGARIVSRNSPYTRLGGDEYVRRKTRRILGLVLLVISGLLVWLGIVSQFFSGEVPDANSSSPSEVADQPQTAPAPQPQPEPSPLSSNAPAALPPPTSGVLDQPQADSVAPLLQQTSQLLDQKQFDAALEKVNAAIHAAPQNLVAYELRGNVYAGKKLWDQAAKDYQAVLRYDAKNIPAQFNLAEIDFRQKKYDEARPGFVILRKDPDLGDLATFKIFLCDLLGGHEQLASKELDAFNQAGSNASYYFANVAWSVYHQKTEDARGWLTSAQHIYAPNKFQLYASSLNDLGYLPLPPSP